MLTSPPCMATALPITESTLHPFTAKWLGGNAATIDRNSIAISGCNTDAAGGGRVQGVAEVAARALWCYG
eukprot:2693768-Rhodomonas_salina.2